MLTGFLAAGPHSTRITRREAVRQRYDELDDIVATIGSAMLGQSIGCARCHDHPSPRRSCRPILSARRHVHEDRSYRGHAADSSVSNMLPLWRLFRNDCDRFSMRSSLFWKTAYRRRLICGGGLLLANMTDRGGGFRG